MSADRVEDVYRTIHTRLWRSLLSFTGDADIASDAESEAFAQALARGDDIDDVASWIWRAAFKIAGGLLALGSRTAPAPASQTAPASDSLAEFISLLGGLSNQQRQCVVLRYVGNFTPTEIAELLGTTPNTVRVQIHRAHTWLRNQLSEARNA